MPDFPEGLQDLILAGKRIIGAAQIMLKKYCHLTVPQQCQLQLFTRLVAALDVVGAGIELSLQSICLSMVAFVVVSFWPSISKVSVLLDKMK